MPAISEEIDELSQVITTALFKLGAACNNGEEPQRLEFKMGEYGEETSGGGLVKSAFHLWLSTRLQEIWDAKT